MALGALQLSLLLRSSTCAVSHIELLFGSEDLVLEVVRRYRHSELLMVG